MGVAKPGTRPRICVRSSSGEGWFELDGAELTLGRSADSDICVKSELVSTHHARLVRDGTTYRFVQVGRTNPTLIRGAPVDDYLLRHGDRLEIAPGMPAGVSLIYELPDQRPNSLELDLTLSFKPDRSPAPQISVGGQGKLRLPHDGVITIGRSASTDLVLPSLAVSRQHARLDVTSGVARLTDTGSANGTYLNGVSLQTQTTLTYGDIIRIGPYKLSYRPGGIEHHDDSRSVRLDVHRVTKVAGGKRLLDDISFNAQPGEVLAIAGTSGAGKSTLIDALNGSRPPTSGHVLINGADLYRAYDALRPLLGYVPQETILPRQLTVRRALWYVARLRLPADVDEADASARIEQVMAALDLADRVDVEIHRLSGGQQKRASIAAELIARPGLFFLDEPTSGLDPGLTRRVTAIVRELAAAGSTVILISHDVDSLRVADRMVFLGSGGRVVFIGTPQEALVYFDVTDLAEIYAQVEHDSESWRRRFVESEQYRERVAPALLQPAIQESEESRPIAWDPIALITAGGRRSTSAWRQFRVTAARYFETTLRDRRNLSLLFLQAPIIALILLLVQKSGDFAAPSAAAIDRARAFGVSPTRLTSTLPLILAATATWFGAINAAREVVKELPMLRRERLAGLRLGPYLASKFVVLAMLCLVQTAALLAIVSLKVDYPTSGVFMWGPLEMWITLNLAAFAAVGLGLLVSASVSNADRAQSLVPILLIPQLIFVSGTGGGWASSWLSYFTVTHWALRALDVTAHLPYNDANNGFDVRALAFCWGMLASMTLAFMIAAAVQLRRRRAG